MNIIGFIVTAAVGLSALNSNFTFYYQNESETLSLSPIRYTVSSDYSYVTFRYEDDLYNEDSDMKYVIHGTNGSEEIKAEKTYDGCWTGSVSLENFIDAPAEAVLQNGSEQIRSEEILIPSLPGGSDRLPDLHFEVLSGEDQKVSFYPQSAKGRDYLFLPSGTDLSSLEIVYDEETVTEATYRYVPGDSEDFDLSSSAVLDLSKAESAFDCDAMFLEFSYTQDGMVKTYVLGVMVSENQASVFLISDDPVNKGRGYIESSPDHSLKASGSMMIYDSSFNQEYSGVISQIKGRGNTTWNAPKKPYQIKLDKKAALLDPVNGKQKAKKWLLLSNPFDPTLLHNAIAMNTAYELGLEETPEGRSVDLYYDGEYRGNYYLCEKVEIGAGRVDIHNLGDDIEDVNPDVDLDGLPEADGVNGNGNAVHYVDGVDDPEDISGGYLLELDSVFAEAEKTYFHTRVGDFVSKEPEYLSLNAVNYISEFVDEAIECTLKGGVHPVTGKTTFEYLDRESFARYCLLMEWIKNNDTYVSSTFFYKPENEDMLYAGPVWDCDASMGARKGVESPFNWRGLGWSGRWLQMPEFKAAMQEVWLNNLKPIVQKLFSDEDSSHMSVADYIDNIRSSKAMNFTVWGYGYAGDLFNPRPYTWQNDNDMYRWLVQRTAWIDRQLNPEDQPSVFRICGEDRYETSLQIAEYLRRSNETEQFSTVILASGQNYPDALCSGYLSSRNNAPIILINQKSAEKIIEYINQNVAEDGKVIVLGGTQAVDGEWLKGLKKETVRISGLNRYETNLEILKACGELPDELIVCTGKNYADSLSASGVDLPVLLADGESLTDAQKEFLSDLTLSKIYIAGGTGAVSESLQAELEGYSDVERLAGGTRYETSQLVADTFFDREKIDNALIAYAYDFPDGLCGGPLAKALKAPVLLADDHNHVNAQKYSDSCLLKNGYVLGGSARFSDETVREVYSLSVNTPISHFE